MDHHGPIQVCLKRFYTHVYTQFSPIGRKNGVKKSRVKAPFQTNPCAWNVSAVSCEALGISFQPRFPKPFDRWRGVCIAIVDRASGYEGHPKVGILSGDLRLWLFQIGEIQPGKIDLLMFILDIPGPWTCPKIVYFHALCQVLELWIMIWLHCRSTPT